MLQIQQYTSSGLLPIEAILDIKYMTHMDLIFFGGFANNSLMFEKLYLINVFLRVINLLLLVVVLMLSGHKVFFYCVIMLLCNVLHAPRLQHLSKINDILEDHIDTSFDSLDSVTKIQMIIDCTKFRNSRSTDFQ
jgi:hypothetical protein